jgi:DHA2 family multidrug resistance protein
VTLVIQQLEAKDPMIDFRVFVNRNYTLTSIVNFLLGTCLFGASFLFSLFCGEILNYAPLDIGLLFLKGCSVQIIMMPLVGFLIPKVDGRLLIIFGISLTTMSIYMNGQLTNQASEFHLISVLFVRSLGLGCVFIPMSVLSIAKIPQKEIGNAVGLFNLTRELGGSIGLAVMSSWLLNRVQIFSHYLRSNLYVGNNILHSQLSLIRVFLFGQVPNTNAAANLFIQNRVLQQANIEAFQLSFTLLASIFFASLFLVFAMEKSKKAKLTSGIH